MREEKELHFITRLSACEMIELINWCAKTKMEYDMSASLVMDINSVEIYNEKNANRRKW